MEFGNEGLFFRLRDVAAGLLEFCFFMSPMLAFARRFLSRLRNMSSASSEIFAVLVLHLDDFFIVCYVSWIRHQAL